MSNATLQLRSEYALSDEGAVVQTRLCVREFSHNWTCNYDSTFQDELVEILSGVEPKFESSVRENRIFLNLL